MGGDAMYRVMARTRARGVPLNVLLALAWWADGDGWCHPSTRQLVRRARCAKGSLPAALETLSKLGELSILSRGHAQRDPVREPRRRGGFQPTNYYRLTALTALAAASQGGSATDPPAYFKGGSATDPRVGQPLRHLDNALINKSLTSQKDQSTAPCGTPSSEPEPVPLRLDRATSGHMKKVAQMVLDEVREGHWMLEDGFEDSSYEDLVVRELVALGLEYAPAGMKDQLRAAITAVKNANGIKSWLPMKGQIRR